MTPYTRARDIVRRNIKNGISRPYRIRRYMHKIAGRILYNEWYVAGCSRLSRSSFCTCGHKIRWEYRIRHNITGRMLLLGSHCVRNIRDTTLLQQMHIAKLNWLIHNEGIRQKMKYEKEVFGDDIRYKFRIRSGTVFYKLLSYLEYKEYYYKPWRFDNNGVCHIVVDARYREEYEVGKWYDISLMMEDIDDYTLFRRL